MQSRLPILIFALVMAAIPFVPGMPPFWIVLLDNIGLTALVAMGILWVVMVRTIGPLDYAAIRGDQLRWWFYVSASNYLSWNVSLFFESVFPFLPLLWASMWSRFVRCLTWPRWWQSSSPWLPALPSLPPRRSSGKTFFFAGGRASRPASRSLAGGSMRPVHASTAWSTNRATQCPVWRSRSLPRARVPLSWIGRYAGRRCCPDGELKTTKLTRAVMRSSDRFETPSARGSSRRAGLRPAELRLPVSAPADRWVSFRRETMRRTLRRPELPAR